MNIFEIVISSGEFPTQENNEVYVALNEETAIAFLNKKGFRLRSEATENTASYWVREEKPSEEFRFFFPYSTFKNALVFKRNNLID